MIVDRVTSLHGKWMMMRRFLLASVTALAVLASVGSGSALAAQAAQRPGAGAAVAQRHERAAVACSGCCTGGTKVNLIDWGNDKWGQQDSQTGYVLQFQPLGELTETYCEFQNPNGTYEFWPWQTGECLALNSEDHDFDQDSESECNGNSDNGASWDQWKLHPEGIVINENEGIDGEAYELSNGYNGDCMYDETQTDAIYSGCTGSDHFEWFVGPVTKP
jgi:hypothetical protein